MKTKFNAILAKIKWFSFKKYIWKCHLENSGHFVPASMCERKSLFSHENPLSYLASIALSTNTSKDTMNVTERSREIVIWGDLLKRHVLRSVLYSTNVAVALKFIILYRMYFSTPSLRFNMLKYCIYKGQYLLKLKQHHINFLWD